MARTGSQKKFSQKNFWIKFVKNINLVANLFDVLKKMNVQNLIVCAGARNVPIVAALENTNFKIESYFEERSAGFYALGKIKSQWLSLQHQEQPWPSCCRL
jgi:hypothetical protein